MGATASDEGDVGRRARRTYATNLELARSLLTGGQPQRALEAARRAQALEPSHGSVVDLIREIEDRDSDGPSPSRRSFATRRRFDAGPVGWTRRSMALTAGERSEALRIVHDVLAVEPRFEPALELQELLDKPARPGRARTGSLRPQTYRQARFRPAVSFKPLATFGEPPGIQVLTIGPDPKLVAVGGVDGSVRFWDIGVPAQGRELPHCAPPARGPRSPRHLPRLLSRRRLSGLRPRGRQHSSLEPRSGEEVDVRFRHESSIGGLAFAPDGSTLASGGLDSTLKLWDVGQLRRGEPQRRLIRQPSGVTALAYSRDGALLVTGHANRLLRVHDARTGRLTATLRGHASAIAPSFSPRRVTGWRRGDAIARFGFSISIDARRFRCSRVTRRR